MSITGSRACNARNSKSSVPAQRIQSQATGKTTTREVPLGLTQVERPPMEEGTMSTLQIWQALQGRSHSLDWLASKTTTEKGTSDTNACIALSFYCNLFSFCVTFFHTNTKEVSNIYKRPILSRRQSSVQQSSSSSYSQQQSGQQSWQQASGGFNARQVRKKHLKFFPD